ncbi:MAG TPA: translation initiation factor IF-3 [Candidatus Fimicola cottocaccae]|nr:translation initiation factor IF-3 [Candidatus Fimicola cottocaccae]
MILGRCSAITELMINEQIRDKEVRLIDEEGNQLGIVSSREAQKIADERKLDLVKIAPTAKPPVCRIMDYGKYKFDQAKKEKEARKKQKTVDVKELRLSPSIDTHDIQVKVKKAIEFLKDGDKVKVSIRFRGREIGHSKTANIILENFAKDISEYGVVDKPPKMEAKSLVMFLAPKSSK